MAPESQTDRLKQQIEFIIAIDQLKDVLRRTYVMSGDRLENSAEHSWQLAVMGLTLAEHANEPVDPMRVVKMVLVHDIVEIDAGDTYCYDANAELDKAEREQRAADRIFGILPADQAREFRALWEEFEARQTPDARFGAALDRLMPILHNYHTGGRSWREHGIHRSQVIARNRHSAEGSEALWDMARALIEDATAKCYLIAD